MWRVIRNFCQLFILCDQLFLFLLNLFETFVHQVCTQFLHACICLEIYWALLLVLHAQELQVVLIPLPWHLLGLWFWSSLLWPLVYRCHLMSLHIQSDQSDRCVLCPTSFIGLRVWRVDDFWCLSLQASIFQVRDVLSIFQDSLFVWVSSLSLLSALFANYHFLVPKWV